MPLYLWLLLLTGGGGGKVGGAPPLAAPIAQEMADAIVAVDKALGLESWGEKPCVNRGSTYGPAKDVTPAETHDCAKAALGHAFPELGKSFAIAILMAPVGPMTVIALGTGEAEGWGAYSCDPGRKCAPMRIESSNKWGKRVLERRARACHDPKTVWLPDGVRACPPDAMR